MLMLKTVLPALLTALTISACGSFMSTPHIKQNPHPRQRYEITIRIDGAPGPFESVTADMQFDISNGAQCAPQDPFSGATPTPNYRQAIALTRRGEQTYKGIIYLDLLEDGNYYRKGVCHWDFTAVDVALKGNDVSFYSGIIKEAITAGTSVIKYLPKRVYAGSTVPDLNVASEPMSDEIAGHRQQYFSITMTARKDAHE
jgi:hypothetical protein